MAEHDSFEGLAERLTQVEERLAALESSESAGLTSSSTDHHEVFWALEGLKQRVQDGSGAVLMTGAATVPKGEHVQWQMQSSVQEMFETDFGSRAESLSALAHPVRLQLLQRLLTDASSVEEIREAGDFGTTGQVYHHLRQLVAAGWVASRGSGRYEVPPARIVPLLVILLGVDR
ncbi:helix-turn-helix domain-containing protein [Nesterenkonia sandarakina]|uniref:DNA-binding transcriptional ArsR family regulator n=1 Tax=Nesterenkonia sandarakina TaxID=272918 RepID=A0A7Z0E918_9MICC|nr:helix-turn-helix domain-containing protein [Nesterenkonia sandarakina]NYJ17191.1 DNA-binding transcriptional ArsR family regulator [Nesterenkonia sandarakina]